MRRVSKGKAARERNNRRRTCQAKTWWSCHTLAFLVSVFLSFYLFICLFHTVVVQVVTLFIYLHQLSYTYTYTAVAVVGDGFVTFGSSFRSISKYSLVVPHRCWTRMAALVLLFSFFHYLNQTSSFLCFWKWTVRTYVGVCVFTHPRLRNDESQNYYTLSLPFHRHHFLF